MKKIVYLFALFIAACSQTSDEGAGVNKLTYHNNPQRTGWNDRETVLTPRTVASPEFDLLWSSPQFDSLNGKEPRLFASPLYVNKVKISLGEHAGFDGSVVFAVSSNGFVYAVSASHSDSAVPGDILWRTGLIDAGCGGGTMGQLSTPVIDLNKNRIYVVTCDEKRLHEAHAIDLGTGEVVSGWPVGINHKTVNRPGINQNGTTQFPETFPVYQRGALNLGADGSRLYVPFGGDAASGWLVALDTNAAKVVTAFSTTAKTEEAQGGMWASGGPAIDSEGRVHIATGASVTVKAKKEGLAGIFPDSANNWGQSIIQLVDSDAKGFRLTGTYSPFNYCQAQFNDIDLGASGTLVIDLDPAATSTPHLLALIGGKQGNAYLLDRNHMSGSLVKRQVCSDDSATDGSLLSPNVQPQFGQRGPINIFGPYSDENGWFDLAKSRTTGAYFKAGNGNHYLFGTGASKEKESSPKSVPPGLVRLKIETEPGKPAYLSIDQSESTLSFFNPGSPVISSNGGNDAIVWVLDQNAPRAASLWGEETPEPVLYALDALTFDILWKSRPGELYTSGKYNEPTVVNGKVFVGTDRVQAFGLRPLSFKPQTEEDNEFHALFDGKTLAGWKGESAYWSVDEGAITGKSDIPIKNNTFLVYDKKFANFEVRLKYRFLSEKGNSGLQYRSRLYLKGGPFSVAGYQANIVTLDARERFGLLWDEHARGLMAYLGERVTITQSLNGIDRKVTGLLNSPEDILAAARPYPEWNDYVVIAWQNRLVHAINDFLVVDVLDDDVKGRAMEGFFALQLHAGPPMGIQVKDIEVKELDAEPNIAGRFISEPSSVAPPSLSNTDSSNSALTGEKIYKQRCASCHSAAQPGVPPLEKLTKLSREKIVSALSTGVMQSQAFGLKQTEMYAISAYLVSLPTKGQEHSEATSH